MSVADGLLLSLWTLWLLVALGLQSGNPVFARTTAGLPESIRSRRRIQALPAFSKEPPGDASIHLAKQARFGKTTIIGKAANLAVANLIFIFVALAPVFLLAVGVTWRSYLMAWLIIHALVTSVTIVSDKAVALVLSTTSLVGLLWLWLQGGGANGQVVAEIQLPALIGVVLAGVTYGLILLPPEIHRRAAGRQEAARQLEEVLGRSRKLAEGQQNLQEGVSSLSASNGASQEQIATLQQEIATLQQEIESLRRGATVRQQIEAHLRRDIEALRAETEMLRQEIEEGEREGLEPPGDGGGRADDAPISYFASSGASNTTSALAQFRASDMNAARLVRTRWFEIPERARSAWLQQAYVDPVSRSAHLDPAPRWRFVVERTIVPFSADAVPPSPAAPAQSAGAASVRHHTRIREWLGEAFDDYAAQIVTDGVYPALTDRWIVQDPGGFAAAADAVAGAQDSLHQLLLGRPAEMVCGTVAPAPVDTVAGGIISTLELPVDRPLRDARLCLELTGLVIGLATGLPFLQIACAKSLGHDLLEKGVVELIKAVGHDVAAVGSEPVPAFPATVPIDAPGLDAAGKPEATSLERMDTPSYGPASAHGSEPTAVESPPEPTQGPSPIDASDDGGFSVGPF